MENNLKKNTYTHKHIRIYITESLCCICETSTTLQINYASIKINNTLTYDNHSEKWHTRVHDSRN